MHRRGYSSGAKRTALCGILMALSVVFLYLSALVPTNRLALAAIAGLFPVPAVILSGKSSGFLCWFGSGVIGLLLSPEKWLILLYLLFLGLYPVLKSVLEGFRSRVTEWLFKFIYFNAVLSVFWFVFRAVILSSLPSFLNETAPVFLALNLVFFIYDIGLSRLIAYFAKRFPSVEY